MASLMASATLAAAIHGNSLADLKQELSIKKILAIEATLKLPSQVSTVSLYSRYYWKDPSDLDIIRGLYLKNDINRNAGIHIVRAEEAPVFSGGSCSVMKVVYSIKESAGSLTCEPVR